MEGGRTSLITGLLCCQESCTGRSVTTDCAEAEAEAETQTEAQVGQKMCVSTVELHPV